MEWILTSDRKPEGLDEVIGYHKDWGVRRCFVWSDGTPVIGLLDDHPTHWMPLPEPPEDKS